MEKSETILSRFILHEIMFAVLCEFQNVKLNRVFLLSLTVCHTFLLCCRQQRIHLAALTFSEIQLYVVT